MEEDINGARDGLVLECLLPVGAEGEDPVRIPIENVKEALALRCIHLVAVDPDLEVPWNARLANGLHELCYHRHVIVDHDNIRLLLANDIGQNAVAEALLERLLQGRHINNIHAGGIGAETGRKIVELLETEMRDVQPGLLGQLRKNPVGDLGVAGELVGVRAD